MTAAAFLLRLAAMWFFGTYDFGPPLKHPHVGPNFPFGYETGSIAGWLATGKGFSSPFGFVFPTGPTAWIGPVYPLLCAGAFKVFGLFTRQAAIAILTMNCVFAALTCLPLFLLTRKTFGTHAALWTGWLWALCPLFFQWPITWVWEISLSALLATTLLWLAVRWTEPGEARRGAILFGALAGFSILTNPALLIVAGVAGLWVIWQRSGALAHRLRDAAVAGCIALVVISPWLVRNWMVFGEPVFVRGNFWVEFAIGNFPASNGMGWQGHHPTHNPAEFEAYRSLGELRYVASKKQAALAFVRDSPAEFVRLTAKRFAAFWSGEAWLYQHSGTVLQARIFGTFSLLALFGLLPLVRRNRAASILLIGVALFYPAVYYLTFPNPRYRHAIEPIMLIAITCLLQKVPQLAVRLRMRKLAAEVAQ